MRKPLIALSLAVMAGLGATPVAGALAASPNSPVHTNPSPRNSAAAGAPSRANAISGAQIVRTAFQYLHYPYTATGNSPSTGFSCIGFVSFVYRSLGIPLPGDLGSALAYAPQVPFSQLQPGDILYFQNTVWNGLSHAAIYIGGGRFIHAEWYNRGVVVSSFNNDAVDSNYWVTKYLGANRPWGGVAGAPILTPPAPPSTGPATGPTAQSVKQLGGTQAVVVVSGLNVRQGPSKKYGITRVIPQNTQVTIIGKSHGWYHVQLPDGTIGWVIRMGIGTAASSSVTGSNGIQQQVASPTVGNAVAPQRRSVPRHTVPRASARITVSGLRVHTAPYLGAPVFTSVGLGQRVQVLARGNGWLKVRTPGGRIGWVVSMYTSAKSTGSASRNTYNSYKPSRNSRSTSKSRTTRSFTGGSMVTAGVRVHATPALGGRVIGLAAAGTHVRIIGRAGSWVLVRLPSGRTGYVYGIYVH
jgi:uncharacterized protein YgiM (DUF1202 family)